MKLNLILIAIFQMDCLILCHGGAIRSSHRFPAACLQKHPGRLWHNVRDPHQLLPFHSNQRFTAVADHAIQVSSRLLAGHF